jgi:outer membrane immunogenic protein
VRGRLGYAFDRVLVYGTGGFAYGSEDTYLNAAPLLTFSRSADLTGWTAGGGVEYAVTNNVSVKTEYLYFEFDRNNIAAIDPTTIDNKVTAHTLKVGLNYAFGK